MLETRHHWLPIVIAVYLPFSFVITYGMAVGYDHVSPAFPYISYTGTSAPESCVFAQLLNIGAVLGGFIIYVKYRQGQCHFEKHKCFNYLNNIAFGLGIIACLGVSIVGNFQVKNISVIHYIGVFFTFVIGFFYMVLQTAISYMTSTFDIQGNTPHIRKLRIGLCIVHVALVILIIVFALVARSKGPGHGKSKRFWGAEDPGYGEYVTSAIGEWLASFVIVIFLGTFHAEFKHFRLVPPTIYKPNEDAVADYNGEINLGYNTNM